LSIWISLFFSSKILIVTVFDITTMGSNLYKQKQQQQRNLKVTRLRICSRREVKDEIKQKSSKQEKKSFFLLIISIHLALVLD